MIELYRDNPAMRQSYLRMNNIHHLEAWTDDGHRFYPALCSAWRVGLAQRDTLFFHPDSVEMWGKVYCPEIPFRSTAP